jgi:hypothetical protein
MAAPTTTKALLRLVVDWSDLPCTWLLQVMLKPIAQALNAVIEPTTQVWFAMQGVRSGDFLTVQRLAWHDHVGGRHGAT